MIGALPETVTVGGVDYPVNTDFRVALIIMDAMDDPDLDGREKALVMLQCLFVHPEELPPALLQEACEQAALFLDGGMDYGAQKKEQRILSWQQDEQLIFSAVNRVAGTEIRALPYLHWWTFLALFREIDEKSLLTQVISIRQKKAKNKPLDKVDADFYKTHKQMIDLRRRYSSEELAEREAINRLLGGETHG